MATKSTEDRAREVASALRASFGSLVRRGVRRLGYDIVRCPARSSATVPGGGDLADVDEATRATVEATRGLTLTSAQRVVALCDAVRYLVAAGVPGPLVECGVWRGGSVLAMLRTLLELGVTDRDVYLFDTFDRMPPPGDDDVDLTGTAAATYHEQFAHGTYDHAYDYLPVDDVHALLVTTGYPDSKLHFVAGLIEQTVPAHAPQEIALLRLDTDYYTSTRHELEHLAPRLAPGGVLLIDDYGHWRGSRKATDEYLEAMAARGTHLYLHRIDYSGRLAVLPR
ncbi:MAG: class I SAM-dependent methyltransferase [Actinomycetota bacterium]|nr:class I SAM-dependent methyltransferase [Actinomycetota bacterium]